MRVFQLIIDGGEMGIFVKSESLLYNKALRSDLRGDPFLGGTNGV